MLTHFINKLFTKQPVVQLGRWNIDYCQKKINKKIDLSNEDHCGTCNNNNNNDNNDIINNKKKMKNYNIKSLIFFETM